MMKNVRHLNQGTAPHGWLPQKGQGPILVGSNRCGAFFFIAACALLSACTSSGAIHQVGPDTYQITHTMGRFSPTTGVRAAITEKAQNKCAKQNQTYSKVREEMGFASGLSYTLIFRCTVGQGS